MEERELQFTWSNVGGRSSDRTAVSASAYISSKVRKDKDGKSWRYLSNKDKIINGNLVLPSTVPSDMLAEPAQIWRELDAYCKDKRRGLRQAKSWMIVLPRELPKAAYADFAAELSNQYAKLDLPLEWVIHNDGNNPHLHMMVSYYTYDQNGFAAKQYAAFRRRSFLNQERRRICDLLNNHLHAAGANIEMIPFKKTNKTASMGSRGQHRGPDAKERAASSKRAKQQKQTNATQDEQERIVMQDDSEPNQPKRNAKELFTPTVKPTMEERRLYPNLVKLGIWPPPKHTNDVQMNPRQISEMRKYWANQINHEVTPQSDRDHQEHHQSADTLEDERKRGSALLSFIKKRLTRKGPPVGWNHPDRVEQREWEEYRRELLFLKNHANPEYRREFWRLNAELANERKIEKHRERVTKIWEKKRETMSTLEIVNEAREIMEQQQEQTFRNRIGRKHKLRTPEEPFWLNDQERAELHALKRQKAAEQKLEQLQKDRHRFDERGERARDELYKIEQENRKQVEHTPKEIKHVHDDIRDKDEREIAQELAKLEREIAEKQERMAALRGEERERRHDQENAEPKRDDDRKHPR